MIDDMVEAVLFAWLLVWTSCCFAVGVLIIYAVVCTGVNFIHTFMPPLTDCVRVEAEK